MLLFTLGSVLTLADIAKAQIFFWIVQLYYELLLRSSPYTEKALFQAEKYCAQAYRLTLLTITFKLSLQNTGLSIACDILSVLTAIDAVAYIIFHVAKLHLKTLKDNVKKFLKIRKENAETKKLFKLTLASLRKHHFEKEEISFEKHRRRIVISVERPYE